ncbi:MAG: FRG domain-containing protein [Bacteroidota bacterium]
MAGWNFRKYALSGTFKNNSFWEILSVAQHNGLPARCLDWSASPLIAAHFATDDPVYKAQDGVIWGVDVSTWKNNVLDRELKKILDENTAWYLISVC